MQKKSGKNKYAIYSPALSAEQSNVYSMKTAWKDKVRNALVNDQFKLFLQPVVDTKTKEIFEFECLLRLCADSKVISPFKFLDIVEEYDMVNDINRWVVNHTIAMLALINKINPNVKLSCNLTSKALQDNKILAILTSCHKRQNDLSKLIFEITESDAVVNFSAAIGFIKTCKSYGIKFSLDDFGVGFSSLGRLKFLPVDYVKIDGSFIQGIDTDPINAALVKAITDSARILKLKTIAEYVSTKKIYEKTLSIEVDYCQGFYFGRPLPFEEAIQQYLIHPSWKHKS